MLVKQFNVNTTMVDSSTQINYIEHCKFNVNQGGKLNDGAEKEYLN
jgi:hypothetical protein